MMNLINQFKGNYAFLSNFYKVPILNTFDFGDYVVYPSVEHAYQAAKTTDIETRLNIALLQTASAAKKAGQLLTLRSDWESIKRALMLNLLRYKYSAEYNTDTAKKLIATGNAYLIEGNYWHDNIWGICSCVICNNERSREEPTLGENWLGILTMHVRTELKIHPHFNQIFT